LFAGCHTDPAEQTETAAVVPVELAQARLGSLRAVVGATGTVEPAPGADWTIGAPQAARIVELPRAEGDRVRKGELLVRFDAPALRAELANRSGELAAARARLENARQSEVRLSGLLERGIAARKEVEGARRELHEAEAAVQQSGETQAAAEELAGQATVHARFDGVVARRFHNPGDLVEAVATDPVLRIVDPSHLEAAVSVPLSELSQIAVGQPAHVFVPGSDAETARVLSKPATVDAASGTAMVRLALPGDTRLTAGTPIRAEIETEERRDVVIVPAAAIVREGGEVSVYVVGADQKAHRKSIELGLLAGDDAEVRSGVAASEKVVVRGHEELPDGAAVAVQK
jgi:RND family efflux transporter MFP subunit